jgi:protocatechuate 3,4-dioxygenase beta subunit
MRAKTKVAGMAVLALLILGGIGLWQFGGDDERLAPDQPAGFEADVALVPETLIKVGEAAADRAEEASPAVAPEDEEVVADAACGVATDWFGEVKGGILSDGNGLPVEGARVVMKYDFARSGGVWPKGGIHELVLVTDRTGDFLYQDVPPGVYEIRIEHPDYAPRTLTGVTVQKGAGLEALSIELISDLRDLGSVEGRVLDLHGNPLSGARVVVHSSRDGGQASALTDASGVYLVERLFPGHYSVSLTMPGEDGEEGRLWQRTLRAEVLPGKTIEVDFRGSGTLTGVILDSEGEPVPDALVFLQAVDRAAKTPDRRANTDENGAFRIDDAGVGRCRLVVCGSSGGWFSVEATTVDLGASDQEVSVRLEAGEISGRLLLSDGKPAHSRGLYPNMMLYPAEWKGASDDFRHLARATPDHTGAYRFRGLPAGKYLLRVHQTGYECPERKLELGWSEAMKNLNLTLKPLAVGTLEVTVVDPEGKPVEGVILNYGVPGKSGRGVRAAHPAPGRYIATTVQVGTWDLCLIRTGLKIRHVPIVVTEGKTTSLTVTMSTEADTFLR